MSLSLAQVLLPTFRHTVHTLVHVPKVLPKKTKEEISKMKEKQVILPIIGNQQNKSDDIKINFTPSKEQVDKMNNRED